MAQEAFVTGLDGQSYVDWQHLTRRLCENFGIDGRVSWEG